VFDPVTTVAITLSAFGLAYFALSPRIAEPLYRIVLFEPHKYPHGEGDWSLKWLNGRPMEDVYFETIGGARLNGWFFPVPSARCTIMVHHGNTGNIADLQQLIEVLLRTGNNVFVYDYRGYGKSESSPSVAGILQDGIAAYDWLKTRCGDSPIVFYGESLGAGVACQLAHLRRPSGLIVQSAFFEMRRIACDCYPFFHLWPASLYPAPYFHNARSISELSLPVLYLHGVKDSEVKISHAHDSFALARQPKFFVALSETDHHEIAVQDLDLAAAKVTEFIEQNCLPPFAVPAQAATVST
jgi:fermentation-respiration switch protein FrsA (DUF1100 family)